MSSPPDEATRAAATEIVARVLQSYPDSVATILDGQIGPFVGVSIREPRVNSEPIHVTVFHDGSFQVEVYTFHELSEEWPQPFSKTIEEASAEVLRIAGGALRRYPKWSEPSPL